MSKTTRLTQQDLQIYPSQRMTDTPDGGGRMVGQPLKGEDNEIFPIVSDVDRTMGSFDARLLYPAVLRDDKEPLYGGHFIISDAQRRRARNPAARFEDGNHQPAGQRLRGGEVPAGGLCPNGGAHPRNAGGRWRP